MCFWLHVALREFNQELSSFGELDQNSHTSHYSVRVLCILITSHWLMKQSMIFFSLNFACWEICMKYFFLFFLLVSSKTEGGKGHTVKLLLFAKKALDGSRDLRALDKTELTFLSIQS